MILGIIGYSVTGIFIIKKENSILEAALYELKEYCLINDMESAEEKAEHFDMLWRKYRRKMSIITKEDKLNEIEKSVSKILPYAQDDNKELLAEIESILHGIETIYNDEVPYLHNIL